MTHRDSYEVDLPARLDALAGRLMATTEHHQYAQLVLEAAAALRGPNDSVTISRQGLEAAYRYIQHCGANAVMRGQAHPQQWIVETLEAALGPSTATRSGS